MKISGYKIIKYRVFGLGSLPYYFLRTTSYRFYLLPVLLATFYMLLIVPSASAGTIIKSPAYLGLQNGLVGCWNFDGSYTKVPDCSGNNNTGTITGATKIKGKVGQALSFDGVDDSVDAGPADTLDDMELQGNDGTTISAWIYPYSNGEGGTGIIFQKGFPELALYLSGNDLFFRKDFDGVTDLIDATAGDIISFNKWHHVLATWDGSSTRAGMRFYLNGATTQESGPGSSDGVGNANSDATEPVRLGSDSGGSFAFDGLIDEVRIYNRALTAEQIARLHRIGLGSTANRTSTNSTLTKGLVGHWTFDGTDISGTRAKDRSGSNNHGTITGAIAAKGKLGQALSFDGVNDVITTTTQFTNPQDFTISAWFKTSTASGKKIVGFESSQTGEASADWDRTIYVTTEGQVRFYWQGGSIDTDALSYFLNDDVWHFAVGTHTSGNVGALYIDGVLMGTSGGAAQNFNGWWRIGGFKTDGHTLGLDGYFPGLIDDVRIYNRSLSAGEISRLYNSTQSKFNSSRTGDVLTNGLVGHWTFDGPDISGTRAKDRSGNNNHGTMNYLGIVPGKIGQGIESKGRTWAMVGNKIAAITGSKQELATLNSTDVAFAYAGSGNPLKTYRFDGTSWAQVGNTFTNAAGTGVSITNLNSTDIAIVDGSNDSLRTYRFDGTDWSQVGNGLTITLGSTIDTELAALNSTDVAYIDSSNDSLRTYRFDGTDWSQVGNGLAVSISVSTPGMSMVALNSTDIALAHGTSMTAYRFNGTDWSQLGNSYSTGETTLFSVTLTRLNATDIAGYHIPDRNLRVFRFDGTDWSLVAATDATVSNGRSSITSLNSTDIALVTGGIGNGFYAFRYGDNKVNIGTGPSDAKTVSFWVKPETTTEYFINLTGTSDYIWSNNGTVTATGFTSPTIYVDGVANSTIVAGKWQHVAIVTDTAENASSLEISRTANRDGLEGIIDDVRIYNRALSAGEVNKLYQMGR